MLATQGRGVLAGAQAVHAPSGSKERASGLHGRGARVGERSLPHIAAMAEDMVSAVVADPDGCYLDATFGRGGHARRLLAALSSEALLVAVDRDAEAAASATELAADDSRLHYRRGRFGNLREHLDALGIRKLSGAMFDVGVSSPQLDDAARGFSFAADGPLDMRMDQREGQTAAMWLNGASESEIADVIRRYGEEHHARRVARAVLRSRPLSTTAELADVVASAVPAPAGRSAVQAHARVFQAVRIHINDELTELAQGLQAAFAALEVGGRLAVITFHGLEHRLVRRQFRQWVEGAALPPRLPVRDLPPPLARRIDSVGKGLRPSADEIQANPRARSALLQGVEKIRETPPNRASGGRG